MSDGYALPRMQRDVLRLCTEHTAPDEVLSRLGDRDIWHVYRGMVRRRLLSELKIAYKRTLAAVGEPLFVAAFEHFMATDPPRARFFHRVPASFEPSAASYFESRCQGDAAVPAWALDLLRYEAARWTVSDLDDRVPDADAVGELNFDGVPVVNPALRLLALGHAVHRKPHADGSYEAGDFFVALHRAGDAEPVRAWSLTRVVFALLQSMVTTPRSLTEAIQAVTAEQGVALNETFLDRLCGTLAQFHERRVILGSRAPREPRGADGLPAGAG